MLNINEEQMLLNLKTVSTNILNTCKKNNISPEKILLLGATKTVDTDAVNLAIRNGLRAVGENRVQEFISKYEELDKSVIIHFIGRLQSNKVKYIIDKVSLIHSVDSMKLLSVIDAQSKKIGKIMNVLIEINIADEDSKAGISPDNLESFLNEAESFENVRIKGLMAIPPAAEETRPYFVKMKQLYDKYKNYRGYNFEYLSMGMSGDYISAVECGANIVRVGSAIFGKRIKI